VLDLDPKGAPFTDVVRVALALRGILDGLALPSYVKTSGATGLHILLPLGARYTYEQTRTFARLLAMLGVEALPDISTVARPLRARGGKVYIDFGQNGHGQTIVAPFSPRPPPGAPASCSLEWGEVTPGLDPGLQFVTTGALRADGRSAAPGAGGGDRHGRGHRAHPGPGGDGGAVSERSAPAGGRTRGRSRPPRA
jgi:bifunctional non-homologous end joining protein LigD